MTELTFTSANFDSEIADGVTFIDFWAPWCGPCQAMSSVVAEIATELAGKVKVGKINVDEEPELAQKFDVMSIPTFKIFKNGKEITSIIGGTSKENLLAEIEKVSS